jgi:hypothetical protein
MESLIVGGYFLIVVSVGLLIFFRGVSKKVFARTPTRSYFVSVVIAWPVVFLYRWLIEAPLSEIRVFENFGEILDTRPGTLGFLVLGWVPVAVVLLPVMLLRLCVEKKM